MKQLHAGVGMGSSELFVLRPKKILDRFLLYFLQHSGFKDAACSTMSGTGGLKRVSSLFLQNCYVPYPNLQEQEEIANYLDEKCRDISSLIEEKELLVADLESYKKSLIFEVVTGKRKVV
jgi:type I restriction enzyme S subunit